MGEHRNTGRGRTIAAGPVVAIVAVVAVVAAVFGWFELEDRISDQGAEAASTCVEGSAVLSVAADPDISAPIEQLATRFNDSTPVIRDHCLSVEVRATPSGAVRTALNAGIDTWDSALLGTRPGLWIPLSSVDVGAVTDRAVIDGTPRALASSPIVLAAPVAVADAVAASGASWADLVRLQRDPQALGLPEWGGLRLDLPTGVDSGATTLAVSAIAAGLLGDPATALTPDQVSSEQLISALSELAVTDTGSAAASGRDTSEALSELENSGPDHTFHAVPVTEQQLQSTKSPNLVAVTPQGPTPFADHPGVVLSGDETSTRAAAAFVEFVRSADAAETIADAGFTGGEPAGAVVPVPTGDVAGVLLAVLDNPVLPRRSTVLIDVSESMGTTEGGDTRLQNVVRALGKEFDRTPIGSELGLWSFSGAQDDTKPYRIIVPTGPMAIPSGETPRKTALQSAVAALVPETSSHSYASVSAAYHDAVAGFVPGLPNSIVLITDGPNDDSAMSASQLLADLRSAADPTRPVAVDVVALGDATSTGYTDIAAQTGGTVIVVPGTDSPDLAAALAELLF